MESYQETKLIKPNQTKLKINQILRTNNFPELKPQMNNDDCFIIKWPHCLSKETRLTKHIARHHHKKEFPHSKNKPHTVWVINMLLKYKWQRGIKEVLNKCYRCKQERSRLIDHWLKWPFCTFAKAGGDFTSPFTTIQQREQRNRLVLLVSLHSLTYYSFYLERAYTIHEHSFMNVLYHMVNRQGLLKIFYCTMGWISTWEVEVAVAIELQGIYCSIVYHIKRKVDIIKK